MNSSCQAAINQAALVAGQKYDILETTVAPIIVSCLLLHFFPILSSTTSSLLDVV